MNATEPGSAPEASRIAATSASLRNFAIGERTLPSASKMRYASPLPPHSLANSASSS